ncbi:MAG: lamin tail domain-containing protein [Polyangiaceae bacterium]
MFFSGSWFRRVRAAWWASFSGALVGAACSTPIPEWEPHGSSGESPDGATAVRLSFDPPASHEAVTRVTRLRVDLAKPVGAPRVLLVEGTLSTAQLRDLARPAPSQSLLARGVPSIAWTEPPAALVVAPLRVLSPGVTYTLGVSEPEIALPITVAADDAVPILPRVWPDPTDANAVSRAAAWCTANPVEAREESATLAPAAIAGHLARGTGALLDVARCVSWFPLGSRDEEGVATNELPAVTPPAIALEGEGIALLEPALLWPRAKPAAPTPLSCDAGELPLGDACAAVLDDRMVVRPPDRPLLFTIGDGTTSHVRRSRAEQPFVVRPLPAERRWHVATLDETGLRTEHDVLVDPLPPRSHVVLNEVMANPAGNERTQEWVELYNDGLFTMNLAGYSLETSGARTVLGEGALAPGAFALVAPSGFVEDDGVDPAPAPGTLILRGTAFGAGGLANDGERLVLRDAAGNVISTFPALKTKNGVSNTRISPDSLDAPGESFAASPNGTATPGRPNDAP